MASGGGVCCCLSPSTIYHLPSTIYNAEVYIYTMWIFSYVLRHFASRSTIYTPDCTELILYCIPHPHHEDTPPMHCSCSCACVYGDWGLGGTGNATRNLSPRTGLPSRLMIRIILSFYAQFVPSICAQYVPSMYPVCAHYAQYVPIMPIMPIMPLSPSTGLPSFLPSFLPSSGAEPEPEPAMRGKARDEGGGGGGGDVECDEVVEDISHSTI
jgi:hypothetical protein